jgi:hypothetical protein
VSSEAVEGAGGGTGVAGVHHISLIWVLVSPSRTTAAGRTCLLAT